MIEHWRRITGYQHCMVSSTGRVRGSSGKILKLQTINSGYFIAHLCENSERKARTVHRLVALAFVPVPLALQGFPHEVNHKNGKKKDNDHSNLEWVTHSANNIHAFKAGLTNPPRNAVIGKSPITGKEITFKCQRDAERALSGTGKQSSAIHHCLNGKKKSAYGYEWRRA